MQLFCCIGCPLGNLNWKQPEFPHKNCWRKENANDTKINSINGAWPWVDGGIFLSRIDEGFYESYASSVHNVDAFYVLYNNHSHKVLIVSVFVLTLFPVQSKTKCKSQHYNCNPESEWKTNIFSDLIWIKVHNALMGCVHLAFILLAVVAQMWCNILYFYSGLSLI